MNKRISRSLAVFLCACLLLIAVAGCGAARNMASEDVSFVATAPMAPAAAPAAPVEAMADSGPALFGGGVGANWSGSAIERRQAYSLGEATLVLSPPPPGSFDVDVEQEIRLEEGDGRRPDLPTYTPGQNVRTRKIVYTGNIHLQTMEFEQGVATLERKVGEFGGFIQSSNVQGRNLHDQRGGWESPRFAFYTARIPQGRLTEFLSGLEAGFNVSSVGLSSTDITMNYFDTQTRLRSFQVQQERLLSMLEMADSVQYLIEVERELARVSFEIESLTSALNHMDDSIHYSTVHMSLEEVVEFERVAPITATFREQAGVAFSNAWRGFANFCRNFVLFMISATPFFVVVLPLAAIVGYIVRRRWRKRRAADQ